MPGCCLMLQIQDTCGLLLCTIRPYPILTKLVYFHDQPRVGVYSGRV